MQNTLLAGANPGSGGQINNPVLGNTLQDFIVNRSPVEFLSLILPNFIGLCFVVASIIFFFMIVAGAIQWITSGGDKNGLEAAKGRITSALIGIIILFSTFAIIKVIEVFFGIHILTIDIGPLIIQ